MDDNRKPMTFDKLLLAIAALENTMRVGEIQPENKPAKPARNLRLQKLAFVTLGEFKVQKVVFLDTKTGLAYRCHLDPWAAWLHYYSQGTGEFTEADHACTDRIIARSEREPLHAAVRRLTTGKIEWGDENHDTIQFVLPGAP